jgi:hypothetical protein
MKDPVHAVSGPTQAALEFFPFSQHAQDSQHSRLTSPLRIRSSPEARIFLCAAAPPPQSLRYESSDAAPSAPQSLHALVVQRGLV